MERTEAGPRQTHLPPPPGQKELQVIRAHLCTLCLCLQTQERGPEGQHSVNPDLSEKQSPLWGLEQVAIPEGLVPMSQSGQRHP